MNSDPRAEPSLTLETIHRVDDVCTIFEKKWRGGQRPVIEDLLFESAGLGRSVLLRELLAVELEYRLLAGERPAPADYVQRFPVHRGIVELTFREADEAAIRHQEQIIAGAADAARQAAHRLPRVFGDYQLLEEIARGGMGVVYKARQVSLDRIVAVKMILTGPLASDAEVERFCVEAQAAAQLDHPHIVPVIEVGQIDGQRYFSMGFVDGISLAHRLAEGPLPRREAVTLLLAVADAVQYAHERGVVHRDLKPANILLDSAGRPRITDFGLAKRVSDESGLTATGQVIGTPSFMPPEQAAGKVGLIGPVSDVYSLGAVLYAVLTGHPPFQAASAVDTLKQVLEQEPVALRRLDPTVPRDLETIALKCLEKNPARRYPSAKSVADELRRFLSGKPILARPVRLLERGYRRCRQYPLVASLGALVTLLLIAVTVTSTVAALRINVLRDEAVEQQQLASANLVRAESERARAERNLQYAHKIIGQLAKSYSMLGDQQQRVDQRLEWYQKAHELLVSLTRESASSLDFQTQLAGSYGRLGILHARAGQNTHAMKAFDQAVEILHRLCQQHPERPQYQSDLARACDYLGRQYRLDNRFDAAIAKHQQACRFQENLLSSEPPGTVEARRDLATYYADLGAVQYDMNHIADSRTSYERARRHLEPLAAQHPEDAELQAALAVLYSESGSRDPSADATHRLELARSILESIVAARPTESRYRFELAILFSIIAKREKQPDQALAWQLKAHDIWERLANEFPSDPDIQRSAVWSLPDDASFLRLVGRHREAADALKRALERMGAVATEDSPEKYANFEVNVLATLARTELQLSDSAAYRRYCQAIMDRCRLRNCYENDVLRVCLILPDAVEDHEQLVSLTKDATSQGSRSLRKRANVGGALYRAGQYEDAIRVLKIVQESNGMALAAGLGTAEIVRADNARVAVFLAMAHARLGRSNDASNWLAKARQWIEGEGRLFAASPASSAGPADSLPAARDPDLSAITNGTTTNERSNSPNDAGQAPPLTPGIEDRMFLADIASELQMLLREAETLMVASTR